MSPQEGPLRSFIIFQLKKALQYDRNNCFRERNLASALLPHVYIIKIAIIGRFYDKEYRGRTALRPSINFIARLSFFHTD